MKFGKVIHPELIDFSLPKTHPSTLKVLAKTPKKNELSVFVGCAKWNKNELKGFYPKGVKDELTYYASQFNAIELNATFYRQFPAAQFEKWKYKTPKGFKFFPKITQEISHFKRLENIADAVNYYLDCTTVLEEKLGTIFLQLHNNFSPTNFKSLENFVLSWPKEIALTVECRHTQWFTDTIVSKEFYQLLEENNISNTIVDSAGRRDIIHMRLTNNEAFIRFVGANHTSDYKRLDDWVLKIKYWVSKGLTNIHFFVHQNIEVASPLLASYFMTKLNKELGTQISIPTKAQQQSLF